MIQNEIIAHKKLESQPEKDLPTSWGTVSQNCTPERLVQLLTNLHGAASICHLFVLKYHETHWNTPSSKMIGVPREFSKMTSHFEIAILRLNLFNFRSLCIFSLHSNDLQCFITFLVLSPKFPYEFMVPSIPSASPMICAPFLPPVSGIRGTFGKRLSDDGEAAAVPGFSQRSIEDFGSKPTFQRWTLHQFADPWGGEWRGFQDVPRNSENLGLSSKSGFQNFVINSSGRCRAINFWRTTGSEKSPRTLVCVLCPMACDLTYTVSMFVWIACTNMLVRKKCRDFTVLRWFKMFYKINVDRVAYAAPRKDYRSLQDEEQRRQRAQDEIQQRLMEEGARVKALEALKHREEETIEHVTWQWLRCRTCAAARIGI